MLTTPTSPDFLWIGSFGHHFKAFLCNGPSKDSGSCRSISSFLVCVVGDILHKTSTNVLILVFEFNCFGNSYAIFGDLWASKTLFNYYIFTLKELSDIEYRAKRFIYSLTRKTWIMCTNKIETLIKCRQSVEYQGWVSEGIHGQASIDTLIITWVTPWLILSHYSVYTGPTSQLTLSTVGQYHVKCGPNHMYQSTLHSMFAKISQLSTKVMIECQPRCQSSIDRGYQSPLDCKFSRDPKILPLSNFLWQLIQFDQFPVGSLPSVLLTWCKVFKEKNPSAVHILYLWTQSHCNSISQSVDSFKHA